MVQRFLHVLFFSLMLSCLHAQWVIADMTGLNVDDVNAMYFTSASKGYAATSYFNGTSFSNKIWRTTNGGSSWAELHASGDDVFQDIHFFDANNGIVTGSYGGYSFSICRTTNGGNNWDCEFLTEFSILPRRLLFLDGQNGFVTGTRPAEMENSMLKTADGGATWVDVTPPNTAETVNGIDFTGPQTGFAVGGNALFNGGGIVYKTTDGGSTWSPIHTNDDYTFWDVHFINANKGYLVGSGQSQGAMFRTTDGGTSWTEVSTPDMEVYRDIHFVSSQEGYASGGGNFFTGGVVLKTTDGGTTWQESFNSFDFPISMEKIHHNTFNSRLYVAGPGGYAFTDGVISGVSVTPEELGIKTGPNPTAGPMYVQTSRLEGKELKLELTNPMGQLLFAKTIVGGGSEVLDLSGFPEGVYLARFYSADGAFAVAKILVER